MKEIEITKISILESGELSVTPIINWNSSFQYIYRTATGVVWNESSKSFMSPVPNDIPLISWYQNIISSVISELGVLLIITSNSQWHNVSKELQQEIESYVPKNTKRSSRHRLGRYTAFHAP